MGYIITNIRSEYANRETGNREIIASVVCDDAASLPVQRADQTFVLSSDALDISTGDRYIINSSGQWILQPRTNAWENVYTKAEIESMLELYYTKIETDDLFEWITATITTDTMPIQFIADGSPLINWSIKGNGQQSGTPTPDNPVMPEFVGTLDGTDWTIPLTNARNTVPVYLGQVSTERRVRKLVLTGEETWSTEGGKAGLYSATNASLGIIAPIQSYSYQLSSHFALADSYNTIFYNEGYFAIQTTRLIISYFAKQSVESFKSFLQEQYQNGTPVTIWYVIEEPETGIVNEPLAKIGDYADELSSADAGVSIPTAKGQNVLTVGTTLQPSEMTIIGKIRRVSV